MAVARPDTTCRMAGRAAPTCGNFPARPRSLLTCAERRASIGSAQCSEAANRGTAAQLSHCRRRAGACRRAGGKPTLPVQDYPPGLFEKSSVIPSGPPELNRSLSTGRCRSFLDLSQTQPTRRTIIARPPVRSRSQRRAAVAARRGPVRSVTNWERTVNRLDWPRCAVREPHPAHHRRRCGTICSTLPETRPSWPDQSSYGQ